MSFDDSICMMTVIEAAIVFVCALYF